MDFKKIKYKSLLPYLLAVITLIIGISTQNIFFKKQHKAEKPVTITHKEFSHLNPFLNCIEDKGLNMSELKSFKSDIDSYINNVHQKHPDVFISYYFRDLNNGMWLGINEHKKFSPASLMKVPVMISVLKEAQKNPEILNTKLLYLKSYFEIIDEESGFEKKDSAGYTVTELLEQMIEYSDNAAALLLMKFVGMDKVAETEKDLNLAIGDDFDINTNFVKVKSYAATFRILYNASYLNAEMSELALSYLCNSKHSGGIRAAIPTAYNVAHKYGERDVFDSKGKRQTLQLHHFGIVYYPNKPFLIGVMTRGSNKEAKEKIIRDLSRITFENVEKQAKNNKQSVDVNY